MGDAATKPIRCAVYTRKSSEEGLEQAFNSLHAQREACEAYILSQKHEGWVLVPTAYDDGGLSGGTMNRPALQALLAEVRAGKVDIIVVYKVDRLTRRLIDFAKMVELFDTANVSFVSVTQAFNTTTSMGRLTLNVLLSFAQFEREVTGERIRDKIAASKAKGMWMGGLCPLGYDPQNRTLVVNEPEAEQVRSLFKMYLKHQSVDLVVEQAYRRGIRSKMRAGKNKGGGKIARSSLYRILSNRLYVGEIPHGEKSYPGHHEPIVPRALFDKAQLLLEQNRRRKRHCAKALEPAILAGLVEDDRGRRLVSTHTGKGSRRYRYYAVPTAHAGNEPLRLPAAELERLVVERLIDTLSAPEKLAPLLLSSCTDVVEPLHRAQELAGELRSREGSALRAAISRIVSKVEIGPESVVIHVTTQPLLAAGAAGGALTISAPTKLGRRKSSLNLVLLDRPQTHVDETLVSMIAQGRAWLAALTSGRAMSVEQLARREGVTGPYVRRLLELAFLAPDLVGEIIRGEQSRDLTPTRLLAASPLPLRWDEQRELMRA